MTIEIFCAAVPSLQNVRHLGLASSIAAIEPSDRKTRGTIDPLFIRGGAVAVGVIVVDVMLFDGVDGVVVVIVVGGVDTPAEQKLR